MTAENKRKYFQNSMYYFDGDNLRLDVDLLRESHKRRDEMRTKGKITIEHLFHDYITQRRASAYTEGVRVCLNGEELLTLIPTDNDSWTPSSVMQHLLEKLGYTVEVLGE